MTPSLDHEQGEPPSERSTPLYAAIRPVASSARRPSPTKRRPPQTWKAKETYLPMSQAAVIVPRT
jgi:hypothetical protein